MYLCYGLEEFFDCKNSGKAAVEGEFLNFAAMLEQRRQTLSRVEAEREMMFLHCKKQGSGMAIKSPEHKLCKVEVELVAGD